VAIIFNGIPASDNLKQSSLITFSVFSPKQFTQIIRLQNVINTMLNSSEENFFKSTEEIGYYDQTHLNKDFKRHMKLTPRQFLNYLKN
jgi:methylphosphotriester-DNA--protein-cysteine methyltransferase